MNVCVPPKSVWYLEAAPSGGRGVSLDHEGGALLVGLAHL